MAEMKWISVSERLPDEGENVLLYCDHPMYINDDHRIPYFTGFLDRGEWYSASDYYEEAIFMEVQFVTHWMPLPQPPKGE